MNITEDMENFQYIAQGTGNYILGKREEEYQSKLAVCMTPEGDNKYCTNLTNLNDKIWGPKCSDCTCPIKIRARSGKGCSRGKW